MKNIFQSFQIALSFFTTIPVIKHYDWTDERMRYIPIMFPFIGGIIGGVLCGFLYLINMTEISLFTKSFLSLLVLLVLTGGLHHDGLMDAADAVFSRSMTIERRLEIMKDSNVGAFGVITMVIYIGLLWTTFYETILGVNYFMVFVVPIMARIMSGLIFYHFPYARKIGLAAIFGEAVQKKDRYVLYLIFIVMTIGIFLMIGVKGLVLSGVSVISFIIYRGFVIKCFGGFTGDLVGSFVLINELILFATVGVIG